MVAKSTGMSSWHYDFSLLPQYLEVFFAKLRIAVVFGGNCERAGSVIYQTHNPRSWKSYEIVAREIAQALREIGFNHVYVIPDDMNLPEQLKQQNIHLVWLNTSGVQGYNPVDLLQKSKAPHPNPPLIKGREPDYSCFPP
jgi:D-alanine-D-alanine ligase